MMFTPQELLNELKPFCQHISLEKGWETYLFLQIRNKEYKVLCENSAFYLENVESGERFCLCGCGVSITYLALCILIQESYLQEISDLEDE